MYAIYGYYVPIIPIPITLFLRRMANHATRSHHSIFRYFLYLEASAIDTPECSFALIRSQNVGPTCLDSVTVSNFKSESRYMEIKNRPWLRSNVESVALFVTQ